MLGASYAGSEVSIFAVARWVKALTICTVRLIRTTCSGFTAKPLSFILHDIIKRVTVQQTVQDSLRIYL
jgi:hypothetical protein